MRIGGEELGKLVREKRHEMDKSQMTLAKEVDVAQGTISNLEAGEIISASEGFLDKLAFSLGITVDELKESRVPRAEPNTNKQKITAVDMSVEFFARMSRVGFSKKQMLIVVNVLTMLINAEEESS